MSDDAILGEVASLAGMDKDDMLVQLESDPDINRDQVVTLIRSLVEMRRPLL